MPSRAGSAVRRGAWLALLLLTPVAEILRAQSHDEPQLVFTIYGGLAEGAGLWHLPVQPLPASGGVDTVGLGRLLHPGLVAGLVTTYYNSPHFGWTADVGYFGIGSEQECNGPVTWKDGPGGDNSLACTVANGDHVGTYVVGILAGVTYRFLPTGPVQPFVRVTAGPGLFGNSSFYGTAAFAVQSSCASGCEVIVLDDRTPRGITWVMNLSTGMSVNLAPGYRVRMEARDLITSVPVASGQRDPTTFVPPSSSIVKHIPIFLFGLDILLERRHGRRY